MIANSDDIITDSSLDIDQFMPLLKTAVTNDYDKFVSCTTTRFIVCENNNDVEKLKSIIAPDSTIKNTDIADRGYLLGMILKYMNDEVWLKTEAQVSWK